LWAPTLTAVSLGVYVGVFAVMAVAATVNASAGFGQGLVAAPLLRLLHPDLLPGPIVIAGVVIALSVVIRDGRMSDVPQVAPALAGRVVGIGIAVGLLATLSERGLSIAVGVIVLTFALLRIIDVKIPWRRRSLVGAGVASGVGGAIASLGGAPMALLYVEHAEARNFRGPISVYTLIGSSFTLLVLALVGQVDVESWKLGASLLPPIVVGVVASRWLLPIVDRGLLRPLVLVLSSVSATVLILSQVL